MHARTPTGWLRSQLSKLQRVTRLRGAKGDFPQMFRGFLGQSCRTRNARPFFSWDTSCRTRNGTSNLEGSCEKLVSAGGSSSYASSIRVPRKRCLLRLLVGLCPASHLLADSDASHGPGSRVTRYSSGVLRAVAAGAGCRFRCAFHPRANDPSVHFPRKPGGRRCEGQLG